MSKHVAPFLRSTYNYDMNQASDESGLDCKDKSLTQQHMKDECDINVLVDRYVVTGEMPQLNMPPLQGDFTNAPTYQEMLNLMIEAKSSFMAMPAKIRNRFENDPGQFIDFCSNEGNRDELRQMGLWSPEANKLYQDQQHIKEAEIAFNAAAAAELAAMKGDKPQKGDKAKPVT